MTRRKGTSLLRPILQGSRQSVSNSIAMGKMVDGQLTEDDYRVGENFVAPAAYYKKKRDTYGCSRPLAMRPDGFEDYSFIDALICRLDLHRRGVAQVAKAICGMARKVKVVTEPMVVALRSTSMMCGVEGVMSTTVRLIDYECLVARISSQISKGRIRREASELGVDASKITCLMIGLHNAWNNQPIMCKARRSWSSDHGSVDTALNLICLS
jgi:hypothetical protein